MTKRKWSQKDERTVIEVAVRLTRAARLTESAVRYEEDENRIKAHNLIMEADELLQEIHPPFYDWE